MKHAPPGALLVVVAAALWGTNGTARALGPDAASPLSVGAVRLALGGVLLLGIAAARGLRFRQAAWPAAPLLLAVACMAAYQPLFFGGISRAGVAVGTVVGIGTSPIAGGLLGRLVRGERLGARWLACTAAALAGAVLLGVVGRDEASGSNVPLGLALACGAGLVYAVYVAASAELIDRHPPGDVAAVVLGGAGMVLVPVTALSDPSWVTGSVDGALLAAWLAIATVVVAYPLLARGLAEVGVGATATLTLAEPATAAALGIAVLGERLPPLGWVGLALVGGGVVAEALGARRAERIP